MQDAPQDPKPDTVPPAAGAAPTRKGRRRSAHHLLLFGGVKRHKGALAILGIGVALAAVAVVLVLVYTDLDWSMVTGAIERLNPIAVLPVMAILPIFGFPISVVYLFAGLRFGPLWGGVVVAAVTAVHLAGSHLIGRSFLRGPLHRFIERRHAHLPEVPDDEQRAVAVIAALVPGIPYFVRNYILVLAGLRFQAYFWVCLPIYVARSYVTILLGDMGSDPSREKFFILAGVDVLKVAICAFVIWRLREHHRKYHGHHDHEHDHDAPAQPNVAGK